jgi:transcriptional regulator with XRE-family HTH domain
MLRGRLLRRARLLLDWSQARLACEAGISSGTVCAVEAGRRSVESPAARAMVQALEREGVLLVPSCEQLGPGLRYAASCAPDHARRHPAALSVISRAR